MMASPERALSLLERNHGDEDLLLVFDDKNLNLKHSLDGRGDFIASQAVGAIVEQSRDCAGLTRERSLRVAEHGRAGHEVVDAEGSAKRTEPPVGSTWEGPAR